MKKVIVAMSGGVDSSVAAALLQEQGFAVEGMFMKNWSPDTLQSLSDCPWEQDQADAAAVCEHLGIPFRSINFEKQYREAVVNYFLAEYAAGRTPNPDILCNKEIKFTAFLEEAQKLGADYIATGHYARIKQQGEKYYLQRGVDRKKDQSYFLYTLNHQQLAASLFPLGGLLKTEVRDMAKKLDLPTALKKDSQGICFIGHIDLKAFLHEYIPAQPGPVYLLPPYRPETSWQKRLTQASYIGQHQGLAFVTVGERAGQVADNGLYHRLRNRINIPPVYVIDKDVSRNVLYITDDNEDPDFAAIHLEVSSWQPTGDAELETNSLTAQIRYQQQNEARVESLKVQKEGKADIKMNAQLTVKAVAKGQSLVVYGQDGETVVGGGIISDFQRESGGDAVSRN